MTNPAIVYTTPNEQRQRGAKRMSHGDLYEKAKTTIDELYSDASVSLETIRSSLEALIEHTTKKLDALDTDEALLD